MILLYLFCFLLPLLMTPILMVYLFLNRSNYQRILPLLCINVAIIGFNIIPNFTDDLHRYFDILDQMRNGGLFYLNNISEYKNFYAINYYFYLISFTGVNELLPALTGFIVYYILLYIIFDFANSKGINTSTLVIVTIFILVIIPMYEIIGGIRNGLAFAVFGLSIYRDIIKKKKDFITYFIYFISIFIHSSIFILLLFRILVQLFQRTPQKLFLNIIVMCWPLYLTILEIILNFMSGIPFLSIIYSKMDIYTGSGRGELDWSFQIIIYRTGICLLITLLLLSIQTKLIEKDKQSYLFSSFIQLLVSFSIGAALFSYVHIFFRYTLLIFILSAPVLLITLKLFVGKFRIMVVYFILIFTSAGIYYQYLIFSKLNIGNYNHVINNLNSIFN